MQEGPIWAASTNFFKNRLEKYWSKFDMVINNSASQTTNIQAGVKFKLNTRHVVVILKTTVKFLNEFVCLIPYMKRSEFYTDLQ